MYLIPMWDAQELKRNAPLFALAATAASLMTGLGIYQTLSHVAVQGSAAFPAATRQYIVAPQVRNTGLPAAGEVSKREEGAISFVLEGGYQSAYVKALPLLERAGLHVTFDVVPEYLGALGYVNQAQMTYVQKHGHDVEPLATRDITGGTLFEVGSVTTFKDVKAAMDDAVEEKRWLIVAFQRIDEPRTHDGKNASRELVRQIVDYAASLNITIGTIKQVR